LVLVRQITGTIFLAISYDDILASLKHPIAETSSWVCHFDTAETLSERGWWQPVEKVRLD
jgi:hypothetical protein